MNERPAPPRASASLAPTFDQQARRYDRRAGLPPAVSAAVAQAVYGLATAAGDADAGAHGTAAGAGSLLVELGAGTGEIGCDLVRLPGRYVGLDASRAMLAEFQAKAAPATPWLLVANADQPWPLRDGGASAIFAARVAHLLQPARLAREARRVGQPGARLLLGRVERDRASVAERLNQQRRQLLAAAGIVARQGEAGTRRVVEHCVAAGATFEGRQPVATWEMTTTADEILAGWATQTRMGAAPVSPAHRDELLGTLRRWAVAELGPLDQPATAAATFMLDVIHFS